MQYIIKVMLGYYCISRLCSTSAEFVDDGLYEAQFFIVFFRHVANVVTAQSSDNMFWWYLENYSLDINSCCYYGQ